MTRRSASRGASSPARGSNRARKGFALYEVTLIVESILSVELYAGSKAQAQATARRRWHAGHYHFQPTDEQLAIAEAEQVYHD